MLGKVYALLVTSLLAAGLALGLSSSASAKPAGPAGSAGSATHSANPVTCHNQTSAKVTLATMLAPTTPWVCQDRNWSPVNQVAWLRIDPVSWNKAVLPRVFVTRITRFRTITLTALDRDGVQRSLSYTPDQARTVLGGPLMSLDLPQVTPATQAIYVRIDQPHNATVLSEAKVLATTGEADWSQAEIMLMALVAGMLITPLVFDINFYIVLRERFVLLHAAMVSAMLSYLLFSGGLITVFVVLPVTFLAIAGPLFWAMGCASAGFFSIAFLETAALTPQMRRLVKGAAIWTLAVPGFCSLQLAATQNFDNALYFLAFVPVIAIYVFGLIQALRRGSHAARYLAAAWIPIFASSIERLLRGMGLYSASSSLDTMLFVALGLEVLIVALGVFSRFIAIKLERDRANSRASLLETAAQLDPLTGLLNRRAIEPDFLELRQAGYCALAVLDLDYFKGINDAYGHATGDRVLRIVADALAPDGDVLVVRMGGEEFALLLRGTDIARRAEQRRQAIPVRVSMAEPGLDRLVTASMGLIEFPHPTKGEASFAVMYEAADRLLYEAKGAGRNRTVRERIQVFTSRPAGRQAAA